MTVVIDIFVKVNSEIILTFVLWTKAYVKLINVDCQVAMLISREVATACRLGVEVLTPFIIVVCKTGNLIATYFFLVVFQVAIVVGGSNFFCGDTWVTETGYDRSTAYQIGYVVVARF